MKTYEMAVIQWLKLLVDLFSWLQRLEKLAMANTSTRVSRPEEPGVKRLVAMAGERDSGETCR